jgi:hypothetical protein
MTALCQNMACPDGNGSWQVPGLELTGSSGAFVLVDDATEEIMAADRPMTGRL